MRWEADKCAVCGRDSEYSIYCCDRCMDTNPYLVLLRHPIRAYRIAILHMFNRAPGDRDVWR